MQAIDSGVVSLAIILEHHGRVEPTWRIRQAAGLDASGSTFEGLQIAGERFGLECTRRRVEIDDLATVSQPALIEWGRRRYVVLEGRGRGGWWINDPARGVTLVSDEEFRGRFEGTVIECRPGPTFSRGGRRASLPSRLRSLLEGCGPAVAASVVASTTLVVVKLAQAGLITYFIDVLLVDRRVDRIPPFLMVVGAIYILAAMLQFIQAQAANRISTLVSVRNKIRLLRHAARLPDGERRLRTSADVAQRLPIIRQMAATALPPLMLAPANLLTIALFGTAIVIISWKVAICILASIAIGLFITRIVSHRIYSLNVRNQVVIGMQRTTLFMGLGVRDWLQESGGLRALLDLWLGYMSEARNIGQRRGGVQLLATNGRGLVNQLVTQIGTLVLGGLGVIQGTVTIGELAALQFLAGTLQASVTAVLGVVQSVPMLRSNLARVDDILEIPIPDGPNDAAGDRIESKDDVDLSGIPVAKDAVLDGRLPSGGLGAVRGLAAEERHRVGTDIATALRDRGCSVRMLSGRVDLFPGSLEENMSGFDPSVAPSRVVQALDVVGLGARVRRHPLGTGAIIREDQPFGDEVEEMQLELATVLATPPSVVIVPDRIDGLFSTRHIDPVALIRGAGSAVIMLDPDGTRPDTAVDVRVRPIGEVSG